MAPEGADCGVAGFCIPPGSSQRQGGPTTACWNEPAGRVQTGLLVISEHTEETLSLKEWEEKLLVVRDRAEGRGPVCAFLGHSGPGPGGLGQQMWDRCIVPSQGLVTQLHLVV